ncbi:hypothetical protein PLICRDRAFT_36075 [Plicaturopsis crispa FD-325 SS-3]|nr:hypothetical protein PLICRDRAFT_36075 [Plicaturopsis crispa FD-325 SS-3]
MAAAVPVATQTNPLLAKYLVQLVEHPLRTKSATSGVLSFLQEILGSTLAGVPAKRPAKDAPFILHVLARANIDLKAFKMALYGFFISAPLSHVLVGRLQRAFAGRTGPGARIAQIVANSLLVTPITTAGYLASMAVINGAKSFEEIERTVKAGFFPVIRVSWVISPAAMVFAQSFVPVQFWVPFFNSVQFTVGTFFNYKVKKMRLAAAKKEREAKDADEKKL